MIARVQQANSMAAGGCDSRTIHQPGHRVGQLRWARLGTWCCHCSCFEAAEAGQGTSISCRQPEAAGDIRTVTLLGAALAEATAIYGFVTALILIGKIG